MISKSIARASVAVLFAFVCVGAHGNEAADQIEQLMRQYHDLGQFSGAVLVKHEGDVIFRAGLGDANRDWGIANSPDTKFQVGSITKSVTALVVVMLAEQGRLDLDAAVSEYLPDYRKDTGSKITLRHLLAHADGIPNYTNDVYFWQSYENEAPYSTSEFIARYCSGDPQFEPGSENRYGNSGYSILGEIIETVTGMRYAAAVEQLLFAPLGMENSGQHRNDLTLKYRATGYEPSIDGFRVAAPIHKPFFAAGSMYTTVDDLEKFDRALNGGGAISNAALDSIF